MLTTCKECGDNVSSEASTCPHCGYLLKGRDHLVKCQSCGNDVIPSVHPHDTLSRYCPICAKPVTNLGCRKGFLAFSTVVFLLVATPIIAIFAVIAYFVIKG